MADDGGLHLPVEILNSIFRFASAIRKRYGVTQRDNVTLCKLCLTSKKFLLIAQPMLYEEYEQNTLYGRDSSNFRKYLRTLIARPDLAATVRKIHIKDTHGYDSEYESKVRKKETTGNDWKDARDAEINGLCDQLWPTPYTIASLMQEKGVRHKYEMVQRWNYSSLRKYISCQFLVAMLLHLACNYTHLTIHVDTSLPDVLDGINLNFSEKIQSFKLELSSGSNDSDLTPWRRLLEKPHLRNVTLVGLDDDDDPEAYRDFAPSSQSIETMKVWLNWLNSESIRYMTVACKHLKSLEMIWDPGYIGCTVHFMERQLVVNFSAISKAINPSIKRLCLNWDYYQEENEETWDCYGELDFSSHKLEHLDVPHIAFGYSEQATNLGRRLPKTLETLVIRRCRKSIINQLLASDLTVKHVRLDGLIPDSMNCKTLKEKLEASGIGHKIYCGFTDSDVSDDDE